MATILQYYIAGLRARKEHLDMLNEELETLNRRRDVLLETIAAAQDNLHMQERTVLHTIYRED